MLLLLMLVAAVSVSLGQEYIVQGTTPDLHLSHKVAAKETWYSIGRAYNLPPKQIAAYNKLTIEKPLEVGQTVKVPLTSANFSQNDPENKSQFTPVYHIVGEKEWMYRVSVNHNKVPVEKLEKWNGITRDQAKAGTKLIVGYLKVKNGSEPQKPVEETPKTEPAVATAPTPKKTNTSKEGGYFRDMYEETGKSSSGVAGIFKSTSGWNDGKYYALMNNVVVGTIVKIVFPQTNKTIYAKVLGELPEMKESAGLALRISDAAAGELGAANSKFSVDIRY
jgi:LysM repeat protein